MAAPNAGPDAATKGNLTSQLAQKTNMNEKFTTMCLEEASWNIEAAYTNFLEAQRNGKIPVEAFEK